MKAWHFSETAYPYLPDSEQYESIRVTLPNRYFDPVMGADLWDRYLEEWKIAEELGFGLMLNEHHSTATCMDPAAPIIAGILARETSTAPIMILGNPIANRGNPVRVAEEMALVDVVSRGRLVVGLVRGVPYEVSAANSKPVRMQERFWEAHDLIKKAWTSHDGPFNWQGDYFEHRQVNIWPRPYQTPHPPIWVTAMSPGSAREVADRDYVAATFLLGRDGAKMVFDSYRSRAAEQDRSVPNDRLAYAALVYTGETDEEGLAGLDKLMWYIKANKVPRQFSNPPGYLARPAAVATMRGEESPFAFSHLDAEQLIERGIAFAGSPDTVYEQIARFYDDVGGFGHILNMGQAGFLDHEDTVKGMRLFAEEVYPRLQGLSARAPARVA
ncbi:MAG: LLM class flavin-dependent oxidoreductase [Pseudonocardiaceae bacterium]|nr:LLM class flavin-dependent oxidoreductase [Pseudonocardiaceae bacterium]